ncbi:MAG TPA: hypothetical protein VFN48_06050 [Solirubrobacteraceae bacterium]|nr:hypothetical protein [Solirubrobacteraceae bacterium]
MFSHPLQSVRRRRVASLTTLALASAGAAVTTLPAASQATTHRPGAPASFSSRVFASGATITHAIPGGHAAVSKPDDITTLDGRIFVSFQNGVGPQGQPASDGNRDSTIVEFTRTGHEVTQWDILGKSDGLGADPARHEVIATVNEDAHSSLYLINLSGRRDIVHLRYSRPVPSAGGTDSVDVYRGRIIISASAPGTTGTAAPQAAYPAAYVAHLAVASGMATLTPLFGDEARATPANAGAAATPTRLALTDPDSNATVPTDAARFGGDFELTSQGDQEQIFLSAGSHARRGLSVLKLQDAVDDSAWPSGPGTLLVTDSGADQIDAVSGPFTRGQEIAAETPCDANNAPATCAANSLVTVDPWTGALAPLPLSGSTPDAGGLLWIG